MKYNLHTEEGIKHKCMVLRAFMKQKNLFWQPWNPQPGSGNRKLPASGKPRRSLPGLQFLSPLERTTVPASAHGRFSSILLTLVYHRFVRATMSSHAAERHSFVHCITVLEFTGPSHRWWTSGGASAWGNFQRCCMLASTHSGFWVTRAMHVFNLTR